MLLGQGAILLFDLAYKLLCELLFTYKIMTNSIYER